MRDDYTKSYLEKVDNIFRKENEFCCKTSEDFDKSMDHILQLMECQHFFGQILEGG